MSSRSPGFCWNSGMTSRIDVILVELREHGRDLALAEGVVERVVDMCGRDAEARSGVAVDDRACACRPPFC